MRRLFILAVFTGISFIACQEEPISPKLLQPEASDRKVLLEKFTGVRCVNCPEGTEEIKNLQGLYGENIIPISIHAGFFAQKYPYSQFDFKTDKGEGIHGWLGTPLGYPSATIDRTLYEGELELQLPLRSWPGHVAEAISVPPLVQVTIESQFQSSDNLLIARVLVAAEQDIDHPVRLTALLTEDNIVDPQYSQAGVDTNYVHKFVLRDVITSFDGVGLAQSMKRGDVIERTFEYQIPLSEKPWWKPVDMHFIAFVTEDKSGEPGPVLNAESIKFVD